MVEVWFHAEKNVELKIKLVKIWLVQNLAICDSIEDGRFKFLL